ncbi:MAG TPA: hypothetical protein VND91_11675, partial [Candidatus Saccharimonadia bacterium]|nr:hypothetical protein [Candidatus Saccharimonadia bacterium]
MKLLHTLALATLSAVASSAHATTYTVNDAGSGADSNLNDGMCSTANPGNGTTCTLRAAIQEANSDNGAHVIKFAPAVTKITLTASLPTITAPVVLDGTTANVASGGRVEIDGNAVSGCIALADTDTVAHTDGATGSTVKNLVVRRCSGAGIDLSGHGYTITGNRVGTNPGASSGSSATDANSAAGISVSGTIPPPAAPSITSLLATLPQGFAGVQSLQAALQALLTPVAKPNLILGNVVSGNMANGIHVFGQSTANTIVAGNIVGLSQDGLSAVPNGRGPGGSVNRAGIRVSGTAWGNFIGPGNIVSGNLGDGIALDPGAVLLPNFVAGNLVGLGSAPGADVGNAVNGISVDTFPTTSAPVNVTKIAAIIGPANTISDNKSTVDTLLDVTNGDTSGGMIITGS